EPCSFRSVDRLTRVSYGQRPAGAVEFVLRGVDVHDDVGRQVQHVATADALDGGPGAYGFEGTPQPTHDRAQRRLPRGRQRLAPQRVGELGASDRPPAVQDEI